MSTENLRWVLEVCLESPSTSIGGLPFPLGPRRSWGIRTRLSRPVTISTIT